jgi:16S rRNA C967 or C1407 C5-methylase (RsmB/RsmF family)
MVSNEVIKTRVNILSENITKWGAANVIVTNNDPKDFQRLPGYFDVIVVDAPCSGTGVISKDPSVKINKVMFIIYILYFGIYKARKYLRRNGWK